MTKQVGAIVLAAGFSSRFASGKLLAQLHNGNKVFAQSLDRISQAIPSIVVVTRPETSTLLDKLPAAAEVIIFEHAEQGMGASLAFASKHIENWAGCLICLADMPFISVETYSKIARELAEDAIIIPTYNSKAGNPVAFGEKFFSELSQLTGDSGGKSIIRAHPNALIRLATNDPGILQDIDTEADLSRYQ